jgi:hypothetical protein
MTICSTCKRESPLDLPALLPEGWAETEAGRPLCGECDGARRKASPLLGPPLQPTPGSPEETVRKHLQELERGES